MEELESKLDWYRSRSEQLYRQNSGKTGKRQQLKQMIEKFHDELRREERQHWRDIQELDQERRKLLGEIDEQDDADSLFESL